MSTPPALDAEALYTQLREQLRPLQGMDHLHLVGVTSGGAWLAERLQRDLQLPGAIGVLSSSMHRDDFGKRGLVSSSGQTTLPFEVNDAHIVILDDVLYTGRTLRAVINELFDYGRPASVRLAVLVDRGGRELPIQADWVAATVPPLPADQSLTLTRDDAGKFSLQQEAA